MFGRQRRRRPARGQSIVEFALVAPLMLFIMFGILDLARIWTTMMSVESAAREAADYGTFYGAERWQAAAYGTTVDEMRARACVAASDLPDYEGIDADSDGIDEDCTNPTFTWCLKPEPAGTCDQAVDDVTEDCDNADRDPPCTVTVTMQHIFHLFVPFHIDFFGVQLGFPATLSFQRDSTFAMTDIDVAD